MGLLAMDVDRLPELSELGWKPDHTQQAMTFAEHLEPARVIELHRSGLVVAPSLADQHEFALGGRWFNLPPDERPVVGDWLLIDPQTESIEVLLDRSSLIKRLAPSGEIQPIAANIDTAFVVTSCNADFSLSRLERYLSVLHQEDIMPVIVLTKADLADQPEAFLKQAVSLGSNIAVELVNALDEDRVGVLFKWCGRGQSIALLGSSGVGKSTLVNSLCKTHVQATRAAREADDKGRHTTTYRSLHKLPMGGVILDSPGMREFQIAEADAGVHSVFEDIEGLAMSCRFNDCRHGSEPGCAVRAAIAEGLVDERRLESYFKLKREDRFNTETVAERHARMRTFGKMVRKHVSEKPRFKRD